MARLQYVAEMVRSLCSRSVKYQGRSETRSRAVTNEMETIDITQCPYPIFSFTFIT